MFRPKPSFFNFLFIKNSFLKSIPIALGITCVGIAMFDFLIIRSLSVKEVFYSLLFGVVFIGVGLLPARKEFSHLASIYETGIETSGVVTDLFLKWWGGYVTYEYPYLDRKLSATERINQTRKTKKLQKVKKSCSM